MNHARPALLCAALAVALLSTGPAHASRILLEFEGGPPSITGYSTLEDHRQSIEVNSFQWGVGVGVDRSSGRQTVNSPTLSDITWTQQFDPSYNALSQALASGEDSYQSTFSFVRSIRGSTQTYLTMKTSSTAISGLSFSSGGGTPAVSASQAFRKFEMEYTDLDASGKENKVRIGYDSRTGETDSSDTGNPAGQGALTGTAQGASGLYLFLGSGLAGESSARGYEGWIELSSAQMGMGISLSPVPDAAGGFFSSTPSISELTVTQNLDRSVIAILGALTNGTMIREARLELVENTSNGAVTTMQLKLEDVLISGLSMSSGGDLPQFSESLNFGAYTQTIWEIDANGRRGGASVFSFDVMTGKSSYSAVAQAQGINLPEFGAGLVEPPGGVSPVPEPHAWALMTAGIAMLLMLRRRDTRALRS